MYGDLTKGSIPKTMISFSIPFLIACFLQSFYGLADLFIIGRFNSADVITAVSTGSQVLHMLTVIIIGLATGTMIMTSRQVGQGRQDKVGVIIAQSITIFAVMAVISVIILVLSTNFFVTILSVPIESVQSAKDYMIVCYIGLPFVIFYNLIASIFRGLGDTRHPMYIVMLTGVINVIGDYVFVGVYHMGAFGAALATSLSQLMSVVLGILLLRHLKLFTLKKSDFKIERKIIHHIFSIGVPIACQEGFIQVSFMVITAIANSRGVEIAAAVGIVEKIIGFFFLVPSAMLSTVSAVAAQNAGAQLHDRAKESLKFGIEVIVINGFVIWLTCQFFAPVIVSIFIKNNPVVINYGAQYLRAYTIDTMLAGIHFCFSGFFSAYQQSIYSFIHNVLSVILVRIPLCFAASYVFPHNLYPMGLAAPLGSILSIGICLVFYKKNLNKWLQ